MGSVYINQDSYSVVPNPNPHPNLLLLLSPRTFSSNRFSTAHGRIRRSFFWTFLLLLGLHHYFQLFENNSYASLLTGEASIVPVKQLNVGLEVPTTVRGRCGRASVRGRVTG